VPLSIYSIRPSQIGLLLIDAQPAFWDAMDGPREPVLVRIAHLLMLAGVLQLPLIATFEHPVDKKGTLPERLERVFPSHGQRHVKRAYNCCAEESIRAAIQELGVSQIAVAGSETDVCVLQSVMGLLSMGLHVFVLEDCLFSSEPHPGPALERMYRAGAIPCTYKSLFYELTQLVGFVAERIREDVFAPASLESFLAPEELPPWDYKR
jgi:nicotinamidase-related amidase